MKFPVPLLTKGLSVLSVHSTENIVSTQNFFGNKHLRQSPKLSFQLRLFKDSVHWKWWLCEAALQLAWNKSVNYRNACCPQCLVEPSKFASLCFLNIWVGFLRTSWLFHKQKVRKTGQHSASDEEESFSTFGGYLGLWHWCGYLFHVM